MILSEKYLAQFERNSGLKKGTVGKLNHLYETYMNDARQEGSIYKFFVVMDLNGESKIIGGNDYKEDAIDAANEYLESGIRLKVYSGKFLISKGVNPEDDSNWGNQDDINSAMQAAGGGNTPMASLQETELQQEAIAGIPSQQDVDAFQASEYEGNDEPENDKDSESQDALHLGENEMSFGKDDEDEDIEDEESMECDHCDGEGYKYSPHWSFNKIVNTVDCKNCGGKGYLTPKGLDDDDDGDAEYDSYRDSMLENDEGVEDTYSNIPAVNIPDYNQLVSMIQQSISALGQYRATQASGSSYNGVTVIKFSKLIPKTQGSTNSGIGEFVVDATVTTLRGQGATEQTGPLVKFVVYVAYNAQPTGNDVTAVPAEHKYFQLSHLDSVGNQVMSVMQRVHQTSASKQQQNPLSEIDNMMGGHDAPTTPDMGGGNEWMDAPNAGQMNSLGGGDEVDLDENNYGTRTGVANAQNKNADFRKNVLPLAKPHQKSMAYDVARNVQKGTTIQRKSGQNFGQLKSLPEQASSLNEDSKALYAKAKVDEAEYERFLRNAGIKK